MGFVVIGKLVRQSVPEQPYCKSAYLHEFIQDY